MRKQVILLGAAALLISACAKAPVQDTFRPLVLTASLEGEGVKTTLDATDHKTVRWSEVDVVAVFSDDTKYTSSDIEILGDSDGRSAKFTFSMLDAGASVSYAVYPAGAAVEKYGEGATVVVPTVQTAVAEGFDPVAAVTIAKGGSGSMTFLNVCAYLAFTIKGEDAANVSSVRIYANEPMTGKADVTWNSGNPSVSFSRSTSAYTGVLLNGPFESGKTYYVAVYPNTYTGLTFKLTHKTTGYVSTYTSGNQLEVARKANKVIAQDMSLLTPAGDQWFEKDPAFIGSSDPVILVGKVGGVYRLVANNGEAGSAPGAAQQATVSGSTVEVVDAAYKWNLKPTSAGSGVYTLYPNGTTARWLYCETNSDSGVPDCMTVGTNSTRSLFTWDAAGYIHTSDSNKDRYLSYKDNIWYGETFPAAAFSFYVQVPNP